MAEVLESQAGGTRSCKIIMKLVLLIQTCRKEVETYNYIDYM